MCLWMWVAPQESHQNECSRVLPTPRLKVLGCSRVSRISHGRQQNLDSATFEWMRTARITIQDPLKGPTARYEADCCRLFYLHNHCKLRS